MDTEANLTSFVLRFVSDKLPETTGDTSTTVAETWHGVIRHVQSNQERHFTRWADAVAFISQFVPVEEDPLNPAKSPSHAAFHSIDSPTSS